MTDAELLEQFESCTLPFDQWTHRTHVKVAYLYVHDHGFHGALKRVRRGIKAYNASNDVLESPTSGYNETITHAFLLLINAAVTSPGGGIPVVNADSFCDTQSHLLSKKILKNFYSPERFMHPEAKSRFIDPDIAPLPKPSVDPT